MTVSLLEILAAARAHVAPLAAESAGYLLLAVADHVVSSPRAVTVDDVELMPDGSVRLRVRRGAAAADESSERSVRSLLARLLEVSSSVGPALRRASLRADDVGLPGLVRELENALIPVNRSAAKRALSRVHRETGRARDAGKLDAWLKAEAPVAAPAPIAVPAPIAAPAPVRAAFVVEPIAIAADFPEPSPVQLPLVMAAPTPPPARVVAPAPVVELTLTPEPLLAVGEPAFTKPEPVVLRAKERGSSTPRLGTVVTAQTLPGEEAELTERAPAVDLEAVSPLFSVDVDVDVDLDVGVEVRVEAEVEAEAELDAAAPQPLVDPEPSCMPDVLTAMAALHTGIEADEAPTRIRDVVTELRVEEEALAPSPTLTPTLTPEPQVVDDAWLTQSSLESVAVEPRLFESEQVDPELHEAATWNPGPVLPVSRVSPIVPALVITQPSPEPSPYAPAVLPSRQSDVSELLDSFYVSGASEERELRSALKEMAGLELTPMPHPLIEEG